MQIVITWSNGMTSQVELDAPADAVPLRATPGPARYDTALHQGDGGRWECHSFKSGGTQVGYCLTHEMATLVAGGHPLEGVSWSSMWNDPEHHTLASVIARCPWIKESSWERDRLLRIANQEKFHSDGHATEEEALHCYQQFLEDFDRKEIDTL